MGQLVAVEEKPSSTQGTVRFQLNRSLTGMGHEYFDTADDAVGPRPAAELARRLFATGQADNVHIYSNIVTVELASGADAAPLGDAITTLYRYWLPGVEPPSFEDLAPPPEEAPAAAAGDEGGDVDPALAKAMAVVPAALLERSRAGRERWNAKAG